MWQEYLLYMV